MKNSLTKRTKGVCDEKATTTTKGHAVKKNYQEDKRASDDKSLTEATKGYAVKRV